MKEGDINEQQICGICSRQFAKYNCPRCNVNYCSLTCYKSESHLQCSEEFYKINVLEDIGSKAVPESEKKNMLEMLQRFERQAAQQDEADGADEYNKESDDSDGDFEERFRGLDIEHSSVEMILSRLTSEEKREFEEKIIRGQELTDDISLWVPWWIREDQNLWPKPTNEIPVFTSITSKVHPVLPYNLVNLLFNYVFICRYLDGEIHNQVNDVWNIVSIACPLLSGSQTTGYSSCKSSCEHSIAILNSSKDYAQPLRFYQILIEDIVKILEMDQAAEIALCDFGGTLQRKKLKQSLLASRKLMFYASFVHWWVKETKLTLREEVQSRAQVIESLHNYLCTSEWSDRTLEKQKTLHMDSSAANTAEFKIQEIE